MESAARGFEEVFLALLVKEMRQGLAPGGMFGHDSGDILGGMFDQFMAQHLAKGAGIGLARALQKHLDQRKADEPAQTDHRV